MTESKDTPQPEKPEVQSERKAVRQELGSVAEEVRENSAGGQRKFLRWFREEGLARVNQAVERLKSFRDKFGRQKANQVVEEFVEEDLGVEDKNVVRAAAEKINNALEHPEEPAEAADLTPIDEAVEAAGGEGTAVQQVANLEIVGEFAAEPEIPSYKVGRFGGATLIVIATILGGVGLYEWTRRYGLNTAKRINRGFESVGIGARRIVGGAFGSEKVAREVRGEELGIDPAVYSNIKRRMEALLERQSKSVIKNFIGWFTSSEERRVVANPDIWTPRMRAEMETVLEVLQEKGVSPQNLSETLSRFEELKEGQVGLELMEMLVRMYTEKRPISSFDAEFQKKQTIFGKYWQDRDGDGKTGAMDVLIAYWEAIFGTDWFKTLAEEPYYLHPENIKILVNFIPEEERLRMTPPEWRQLAAYALPKDVLAQEGFRAARRLGERMQQVVISKDNRRGGYRYG